jgi:ribose transport system ATP-binding protein
VTSESTLPDAAAPALQVSNLSKTFPGTRALTALDLTVPAGEVHALLGGNGCGKSTLIKILSGYHRPDPGGSAFISGAALEFGSPSSSYGAGARFVHQDLGLVDDASILDNVAIGSGFPTRLGTIRSREARRRVRLALSQVGLDLDPELLVKDLAAAEKTGVALARALGSNDGGGVRLLVLDEPTATLPGSEVEHLLGMVKNVAATGAGVIYVTHHLDEVFHLANTVTVLRNGHKLVTTPVAQLTHAKLLHYIVGSELEAVRQESDALPPDQEEAVLDVRELRAGRLAGASFQIRAGDVVGVAGVTGSGREAVAGAIYGALKRDSGEVRVNGTILPPMRPDISIKNGVAYLPPDRKRLGGMMEMTARENVTISGLRKFWRMPLLRRRLEAEETLRWSETLNVRPPRAVEQRLLGFSGGNQQKLLLAKWLRLEPRLLLLDEPTQGVDVGAKVVIHRQILAAAAAGASVLISSVDIEELVTLCHRVLIFRNGRLATTLTGDRLTEANATRESLASDRSKEDPGVPAH